MVLEKVNEANERVRIWKAWKKDDIRENIYNDIGPRSANLRAGHS